MSDVEWGALAAALTILGGVYTWHAYQRRGTSAALKGAGLTLLAPAAYLTDTLRMFGRILDAVVDWATRLVFSPVVWVGIVLAGLAVVLYGTGRLLERRSSGETGDHTDSKRSKPPKQVTASDAQGTGDPEESNEMADIEAILRKHGIT